MKTILFIIISSTVTLLSGCKKDYTCVCSNPGGTTDVFTVKDTKSNATKKCSDYYAQNVGNVAWNETSCSIK
jgi:predicted metal-binding protein